MTTTKNNTEPQQDNGGMSAEELAKYRYPYIEGDNQTGLLVTDSLREGFIQGYKTNIEADRKQDMELIHLLMNEIFESEKEILDKENEIERLRQQCESLAAGLTEIFNEAETAINNGESLDVCKAIAQAILTNYETSKQK